MVSILVHKTQKVNYYNWIENYALKRFHPTGIIFELIGLIWVIYYLWNQIWQWALAILILSKVISILAVIDVDPQKMSETMLGKLALLHLHPTNVFLQVVGAIVLFFGLYNHFVELILLGFTFILLGHLLGWPKVDSRLAKKV